MRYTELVEYIDPITMDIDKISRDIKQEAWEEVSKMTPKEIFYYLKSKLGKSNAY
jgi:hypothetical protein